MVEFIRWKNF